MPKILPFKAVRPTRDKVCLIASRAYDSYTREERDARLRDNPFSFLHIVNPGFKYHKVISGKERYKLVRNRYQEFKEDGIFIQDQNPCYYVYKIVNRDGLVFRGIVAATSVEDYKNDLIKKHEDTIEFRETMFKDYLKTVGFNAEAVLLTYPDNSEIKQIIDEVMVSRAEYEFTTTYKDTHYLWCVDDTKVVEEIARLFQAMPEIYIADGHHRCSSSYLLAEDLKKENKSHTGKEPYNYFMSYLIPESDLKIYEFNRLITDLNGMSNEEFLIHLDTMYRIEERGAEYYKPSKKHHFSMYLDGSFYSLYLRKHNYEISNALDALDTQILHSTILKPILGIEDARNDKRLNYTHGKMDMAFVKSMVDSGEYKVGFGLLPITVSEMKNIADEGHTMPPKSTYIEPKLRSGVTIYEF
ncbi:MAG: DUF1015 domain-containing protein [Bacteroidia bacterium]|nr:DUF1015 domain-containing protein [Bacteroidia bacterium]NNF31023.1 DUF1015 domain-containing protein [Flavobacteriaceae bacterium]MBT8276873.1 DUF1015 domain-containing protein [Bacteroidia bacterium]NNJ82442.1 DUF1015 domain-containing protein [Flavobacteriaceae bacterium]NNK53091.1 DUF1015 domain-containing protein [Flavobacteriaceae bacterium]